MRILFVGNSNRKFLGKRYYLFDQRIYSGLLRAGHAVHFFCDRTEAKTGFTLTEKSAYRNAAKRLLKVADNFRPDALVITHSRYIDMEALKAVRERYPHIRMAQFNVDVLYSAKNQQGVLRRQSMMDANFITTGGPLLKQLSQPESPFYFVPNLTDPGIDEGRAHELERPAYDVSCFMHGSTDDAADHESRRALANGLVQALPALSYAYRGFDGHPGIYGQEYIQTLSQSAMALNLSRHACAGMQSTPETRHLYSSDRLGHLMGNGCLTFIETGFALEQLYSDKEAVFFSDKDELIEKVRHYASNSAERQAIAKAGWKKAHEEFSTTVVMQYVLERLFEQKLSRNYAWPTE